MPEKLTLPRDWKAHLVSLGADLSEANVERLKSYILFENDYFFEEAVIPRYAAIMLLGLGERGVWEIYSCAGKPEKLKNEVALIDTLFSLSRGVYCSTLYDSEMDTSVFPPITPDIIRASKRACHDLFFRSIEDEWLFSDVVHFLNQLTFSPGRQSLIKTAVGYFRDTSIRLNHHLLSEYERLIKAGHVEETYQVFFEENPVFLDPLAAEVIPKHRLGAEFITDFVIRRLNNEYIVVEIERPDTPIFTQKDDFTYQFTHAQGQVMGFQDWVESNIDYARKKLPDIAAPAGLLVIGTYQSLTESQKTRLRRNNINQSGRLRVVTFDQVLGSARDLYENILRKQLPGS